MGCHRKQSRTRTQRLLPIVAAPALAGVATAFCLSPQALADPSTAHLASGHAVVADAATRLDPTSTQLLSVIARAAQQQATQHKTGSSQPSSYTVRSGDSLSTIAGRVYHNQNAWPVLYWANRSKIHSADVIDPGQVLRIPVKPAKIPAAPSAPAPAPAPAAQTAAPVTSTQATADVSYSGAQADGSFASCVIARESGGNSQVMNATGHYGLYQFSASTWAEYGGSAADFGNASVAEQNQVFDNAIAAGGESNWSAYDGC